jgi:hypothetical protein
MGYRSIITLLASCLLLACFSVAAADNAEIRFAKGATSKTIKGEWNGLNKSYRFRAKKGQRLDIRLNDGKLSSGHLNLTVYEYCGEEFGSPIAMNIAHFKTKLACHGEYSFDITKQDDIAINQDSERYTITISIK